MGPHPQTLVGRFDQTGLARRSPSLPLRRAAAHRRLHPGQNCHRQDPGAPRLPPRSLGPSLHPPPAAADTRTRVGQSGLRPAFLRSPPRHTKPPRRSRCVCAPPLPPLSLDADRFGDTLLPCTSLPSPQKAPPAPGEGARGTEPNREGYAKDRRKRRTARGMLGESLSRAVSRKALPEMSALKPYRGKPAERNFRGF